MATNNNLLIYTQDLLKGYTSFSGSTTLSTEVDATVNGGETVLTATNSNTDGLVAVQDTPQMVPVTPGKTYTASADFKANHTGNIFIAFKLMDANKGYLNTLGNYGTRDITYDTWYRISGTITIPDGVSYIYVTYRYNNTTATYPSKLYFCHPKVEEGAVATAYRPAGVESPNLIRNAHFYKGIDFWSGGGSGFTYSIDADASLRIKEGTSDTSGVHVFTQPTQTLGLNQTYMLTIEMMNNTVDFSTSVPFFISYGTASLGAPVVTMQGTSNLPADGQYHTYVYKITIPASGNPGNRLTFSSTTFSLGQALNIKSIKLEKGLYATEWTAAPEDVAIGTDRLVIATAQYTITDWNDSLGLTLGITPNQSVTQQYNPTNETFSPDWTASNLILTASLYDKTNTNVIGASNIQSIKWYTVNTVAGTTPVLLAADTNYGINAGVLTVKQNILNDKNSADFICEVVYRDSITSQDHIVKKTVTVNRVINGAVLTKVKAYLPNGNGLTNGAAESYDANVSDVGRNVIKNSNFINGTANWYSVSGGVSSILTDTVNGYSTKVLKSPLYTAGATGTYTDTGVIDFVAKPNTTYTFSAYIKGTAQIYIVPQKTTDTSWTPTATYQDNGRLLTGGATYSLQTFTTSVTPSDTVRCRVIFRQYASVDNKTTEYYVGLFKIEAGSTRTRWSAAPEDYPVIDPSTTSGKWIFNSYDIGSVSAQAAPTYDTLKGKLALEKKLVSDTVNVMQSYGASYLARLRTAVYTDTTVTVPFVYGADDGNRLYINGQSVEANSSWSSAYPAVSINLKQGWNTIDALWAQGNGGDGFYATQVGNRNLIVNSAGLVGSNLSGTDGTVLTTGFPNWYSTDFMTVTAGSSYSLRMNTPNANILIEKVIWYDTNKAFISAPALNASGSANNVLTAPTGAVYIRVCFRDTTGTAMTLNTFKSIKAKFEAGSTATIYSLSVTDSPSVDPNTLGAIFKLDASYAEDYASRITNLTAKAEFTRGSVIDTTNVTYQWYKQDSTITTSQGGGIGWLKLIATSPETGYNTDTLTIPSSAIDIFEVYKIQVKDMQVDSITYNTTFEAMVSVTNSILPIEVRVESDGLVLLNGQGNKTLKARLYQNNKEIDTEGTIYTYKWYRWLNSATQDTTWNSNTGYKTGKTLSITPADVATKCTFSVDVS